MLLNFEIRMLQVNYGRKPMPHSTCLFPHCKIYGKVGVMLE